VRALALILALAAASPAAAQRAGVPPATLPQLQIQQNAIQAQMDLARQQQVGLQNELAARDAQLRADAAVANLQAQVRPPPLNAPDLYVIAAGAPPPVDQGPFPQIPDATLAASNQRVLAASKAPN
jgi:hypothetical protein